ncbi:MAG TPA: mannitol dehydrogenase family protein, partial [Geminicoccaceae bacterium]
MPKSGQYPAMLIPSAREASRDRSIVTPGVAATAAAAARPRLARGVLRRLPPGVRRPAFDVEALRPGILHLGCGAFHRAHQAVFTQRALEAEGPGDAPAPWGIVSASLCRAATRDALRPQEGLYAVLERGPGGTRAEVVGSLCEVLFAPDDPSALLARFRDPGIRIVTLTVTGPAYCLDPGTGRLCPDHPDIRRDLGARWPRSAVGVLARGLAEARRAGRRPPVVLSCDNLAANGRTLRQAVVDYAALSDDRLAAWIAGTVQFPSCMVDRIVPTASGADREDAASILGFADEATVAAEPFRQWVIEQFDGPRPLWEAAGAQFVGDVSPWEASKLRLLNGTHLAIACLGLLAGLRTVGEFVAEPAGSAYALRMMLDEQAPTLPPGSGHDIPAYARQLLERWRNPGIAHELARVGRNGSEKLPTRLLATLRDNLAAGRPAPCTILAVAAWILCAAGRGTAPGGTPQ